MNKDSGFTLIELLVVLIIIGLMSSFVAPRFIGSLSNLNLKTCAKKVSASLRYARSQAVSEKRAYVTIFDREKQQLLVTPFNKTGDLEKSDRKHDKIYKLPHSIRFSDFFSAYDRSRQKDFQIIFYPGGNSSGGRVSISDDENKVYTIRVDFITGIVQLIG